MAKIFIGSTGQDLEDYRDAAVHVCNELGFVPIAMEYFPAMGMGATAGSLKKLEEADVYVGIFAYRYGYVESGYERSVTEAEYDAAGARKIERLCFLVDPKHHWPPHWVDDQRAPLNSLKDRIRVEVMHAHLFTTVDNFRATLMHSLIKWKERNPEIGVTKRKSPGVSEIVANELASYSYLAARRSDAGAGYGIAACSAFALGDVSVLETKLAFTITADAYVHAFVVPSQAEQHFDCYVPDNGNTWKRDEGWSNRLKSGMAAFVTRPTESNSGKWGGVLQTCFDVLKDDFNLNLEQDFDITVVMEAPPTLGIGEEQAVSLALSEALINRQIVQEKRRNLSSGHSSKIKLGALLSTTWYDAQSWASVYASSLTPSTKLVQMIDRSKDGSAELLALAKTHTESLENRKAMIESNLRSDRAQWTVDRQPIRGSHFSIWQNANNAPPEPQRFDLTRRFKMLEEALPPLTYVAKRFGHYFETEEPETLRSIGRLMQMHHLLLELIGIVPNRSEMSIPTYMAGLDSEHVILAAKMAHARGGQGVVILTSAAEFPNFKERMNSRGLKALEDVRQKF